jgi:hypothetical protein
MNIIVKEKIDSMINELEIACDMMENDEMIETLSNVVDGLEELECIL